MKTPMKIDHMELNTNAYDDHIASLFAPQDSTLTETVTEMEREGIPGINVFGTEGKLLQVLALAAGVKRILEVGTLGGYSGIHLARALPGDGKLITLEIDPYHAEIARRSFERAEVSSRRRSVLAPLRRRSGGWRPRVGRRST